MMLHWCLHPGDLFLPLAYGVGTQKATPALHRVRSLVCMIPAKGSSHPHLHVPVCWGQMGMMPTSSVLARKRVTLTASHMQGEPTEDWGTDSGLALWA